MTAAVCGLAIATPGVGSAFGLYVLDGPAGEIDWRSSALLHLAAVTRGVYYGSGGEFGLCTQITDEELAQASSGLAEAIGDVAAATSGVPEPSSA